MKSIEISEDSQLLSIGEYAFENTLIEEIFIPSKTIKIEENCFENMYNIKRIIISPENKKFGYISGEEEKLLLKNQILKMITMIFFFLHALIKKKSSFHQ